jgi:hypothetical protein
MERRTKFILLIVLAVAILAFGIWYLFQPIIRGVEQPPELPGQVTPGTGVTATSTRQPPTPVTPTALPTDVKQIQNLSGIFVARLGSGSSGEGFSGYTDVLINATPAYQQVLRQEQTALRIAHPASGPAYGIVTRVVAIDPISANSGAAQMTFRVQVQQAEDAGDPSKPTRVLYKEATVTFDRQADGGYLVSNVVWKDIER